MARTIMVAGAIVATFPILVSAFYLYRVHDRVSSQTQQSKGCLSSSSPPSIAPKSLPAHVASDRDSWIVNYERVVSHSVRVSDLAKVPSISSVGEPSELVKLYVQNSHYAFSCTPQAFVLRMVIKDPEAKHSFSAEYIKTLDFRVGQRVNGAYTVTYVGKGHVEGSERVELALDPPKGYRGPSPQGCIISEVRPAEGDNSDGQVVFVNETWMWRKESEPKTLLEGGVGAWIHALTSGWLILEGLKGMRRSS